MLEASRQECALSVVIPVRDGAGVIGRCLRALAALETGGRLFEVIVVDNGSTDDTAGIARSLGGDLNLTILARPGAHIAALRNAGAAGARGTLLAFLDADCVVGRRWLLHAIGYPWNEQTAAIGAFFTAGPGATWVARTWCRFESAGKCGCVGLLPSGNMIVSRAVFEALGGFNEALETNEDADFCRRITASGLRIEAVPELQAIHLGAPQSLAALYRREVWHGKDVLAVCLRCGGNGRAVGFALYALFWGALAALALAWWIWSGRFLPAAAALAAFTAAPAAISLRASLRSGHWADAGPLTVLLAVYGVARATALFGYRAGHLLSRRGSGNSTVRVTE